MLYPQAKVWGKQPGLIDRAILNVSDYQSGPAEYVFPQLLACECSQRPPLKKLGSNFAFLNTSKHRMIDKVKEVNCADCNMVQSDSCRTLIFCSQFIVYSLSSDPLRLYTNGNRNCPKNIVKYTIRYMQYIFSVYAFNLSWPHLFIWLGYACCDQQLSFLTSHLKHCAHNSLRYMA